MKTTNFAINDGKEKIALATTDVFINGESKNIIPAFTQYSIKRKDFSKKQILKNVDKAKILPTIFNFTHTQPFREENVKLVDFNGIEIPRELDDTVLVYLDTANTINLFSILDTPLNAKVLECGSVAEAYSLVVTTAIFAQCPTKDEWIGLTVPTTNDNVLQQVLEFSNSHKVNGTAAQAYFGFSRSIHDLQKAALTKKSPLLNENCRSFEEATQLYEAVTNNFGARYAAMTRYIRAINVSININSFDEVIVALGNLPEEKKIEIISAKIEEKNQHIQAALSEVITKLKEGNAN